MKFKLPLMINITNICKISLGVLDQLKFQQEDQSNSKCQTQSTIMKHTEEVKLFQKVLHQIRASGSSTTVIFDQTIYASCVRSNMNGFNRLPYINSVTRYNTLFHSLPCKLHFTDLTNFGVGVLTLQFYSTKSHQKSPLSPYH